MKQKTDGNLNNKERFHVECSVKQGQEQIIDQDGKTEGE